MSDNTVVLPGGINPQVKAAMKDELRESSNLRKCALPGHCQLTRKGENKGLKSLVAEMLEKA